MNWLKLRDSFKNRPVFSLADIRKIEPGFYRARLSEWQKKGYIKKIIKNYYFFSDQEVNEDWLFLVANKIYTPSYISLEMALAYYHLIPESTYTITSITTKKTINFNTQPASFSYRSVTPKLFFGYHLIERGGVKFKIAEPEKAVLDWLYLNPDLKRPDDFSEMRFNREEWRQVIDQEKLNRFLDLFDSKTMTRRVRCLV